MLLLLSLSFFPAVAGAIVFNLGDQPNLSVDSRVEYSGDSVVFTGSYTGDGKIARIEWELASDPTTNVVSDAHAPKQNWSVTDNSPVDIIYSAPNDPTHYEIYFYDSGTVPILPAGLPKDSYVSYTFHSDFTANHQLAVGESGFVGMEYIMERLYGDNPVTSFLNEDGTLLFEAATIELVLGSKATNELENTVVVVPSYQVTAVPEPAQIAVIFGLIVFAITTVLRRR